MKSPIVIFYHIFCYGDWQAMVTEQLNRLKQSGVYDACSVMFVRLIGDESNLVEYREMTKEFRKIHLIGEIENNDHEITILKAIWTFANETMPFREQAGVDANVLYLHTKGVYSSRQGVEIAERMNDWRHYMEYFVVDHWQDCVEKLENGFDVCGVNWREQNLFGPIVGHFSGNFWWAKLTYIYKLPEVKEDWDRAYYEFWIGQGQPKVHCMFESGIDHYHESFPADKYTSRECKGD